MTAFASSTTQRGGGTAAGVADATSIRERRSRLRLLLPASGDSSDNPSDGQLFAQFQGGSQVAFQTLYRRHYHKAHGLAVSLTRDENDACEVVQEAFIRVLRKWSSFEGHAAFYTWLYRIVYNLSIDRLRRPLQKRVPFEHVEGLLGDLTPLGMPAIRSSDPFEACFTMESGRQIIRAIQSLPSHHRDVIVMREMYGMSYAEMAESMGCSKGTIMSRLFHARQRLQALLRWLMEERVDARVAR